MTPHLEADFRALARHLFTAAEARTGLAPHECGDLARGLTDLVDMAVEDSVYGRERAAHQWRATKLFGFEPAVERVQP